MTLIPATSSRYLSMFSSERSYPFFFSFSAMLSRDFRRLLMSSIGFLSNLSDSSSLSTLNFVSTSIMAQRKYAMSSFAGSLYSVYHM